MEKTYKVIVEITTTEKYEMEIWTDKNEDAARSTAEFCLNEMVNNEHPSSWEGKELLESKGTGKIISFEEK